MFFSLDFCPSFVRERKKLIIGEKIMENIHSPFGSTEICVFAVLNVLQKR